jgi:hypothetical protein
MTENVQEPGDSVAEVDLDKFDLDLTAEVEEIKTIRVKVNADGDCLVFPARVDDWPLDAIDLLGTAGTARAGMVAAAILDEDEDENEGHARVLEIVGGLTGKTLTKIMEHLEQITGTTPGKGNRSARRSPRTVTR